jgi:3-hydroxyacyl-CoA dehydrogenase/enoyl-CoA hydratase/carnithine racemase
MGRNSGPAILGNREMFCPKTPTNCEKSCLAVRFPPSPASADPARLRVTFSLAKQDVCAPVSRSLSVSFPQPHVAVLTFNLPGKSANVLSAEVMQELADTLETLQGKAELQGLILTSAKRGTFIAGADIREFVPLMDQPTAAAEIIQRGHEILDRLATWRSVTIVAIDGVCVGGGLELALACDRRIVSTNPKTQLGLPEVKLGLIPGWGGCARLPRLIGLASAVEMITTGKLLGADAAVLQGLADESVPSERLLEAGLAMVAREQTSKAYVADRARRCEPIHLAEPELEFIRFNHATKLQAEAVHQPAAMSGLNLLLDTAPLSCAEAQAQEATAFHQLFGTPTNRGLVNVFLLQDHNKHAHPASKVPSAIKSLSVLGAGTMGVGIAAAGLKAGLNVRLGDANEEILARGAEECLKEAAYDSDTKGIDVHKLTTLAARLSSAATAEELAAGGAVIEAITEKLEVKLAVLRRMEAHCSADTFLASNTSTIPISKIGAGLSRPDRFCGMHFFNPVRRMKLVEIIRGEQTSEETIAGAVALARRMGKMPIVVADGPGFVVNRILSPYLNEATELLQEGNALRDVDAAALEFGMPIGPIALYDLIGLDTAFRAGCTMWEAYPDRVAGSPILPALIKKGRLGRKNLLGFYSYADGSWEPQDDPAAEAIVQSYVRAANPSSPTQMQDRLLLVMLLEACRLLADGRVRDGRDIDLGVVFGLGFPAFRGGILHWAEQQGGAAILRKLDPWRERGGRFNPPGLLLEWASGKRKSLTS